MVPSKEIQGQSLFFMLPNQKAGRKLDTIFSNNLEICRQIFEETRVIQDAGQFTGI